MISEEDVEKAVDYLRTSAPEIAKARAEMIWAEQYRKSLKAMLMSESKATTIGEREQHAYCNASYLRHLDAYKKAVFEYEKARAGREGATARIEAWRSLNANYRGIKL